MQPTAGISLLFVPFPGHSVHLHRVVSVERLALWLDGHTSPATRKQLSPNFRCDFEVTMGEQQV